MKSVFTIGFFSVLVALQVIAWSGFAKGEETGTSAKTVDGRQAHGELIQQDQFPSAVQCAHCHQRHFREWSYSGHAYASISPVFHKFEEAANRVTRGTIGTFCVRCHLQVGTQIGEPRHLPLWDRQKVAREGVTCITCHRVNRSFGKVNGERHVQGGTIHAPVYNAGTGVNLPTVLSRPKDYKVATRPGEKGTPGHVAVNFFEQIGQSEFCVSCHQVAVNTGVKLEVVWDQYRASPALKAGTTCQACHTGTIPGIESGYDKWPVAIVNGHIIGDPNAKHTNHSFYGPGYPIAHLGLFPFNPLALKWSIKDWLKFD